LKKVGAECVFFEINDDRMDRSAAGGSRFLKLPDVRQIGAEHCQVTCIQLRNVVADDAMAGPFEHKADLVFRMKMPRAGMIWAFDFKNPKALLLSLRDLMVDNFHRGLASIEQGD